MNASTTPTRTVVDIAPQWDKLFRRPQDGYVDWFATITDTNFCTGYIWQDAPSSPPRPANKRPANAAPYALRTTDGPTGEGTASVLPIYATPDGAVGSNLLPEAACETYDVLTDIVGWASVWEDDKGYGISGIITATGAIRRALEGQRVFADYRYNTSTGGPHPEDDFRHDPADTGYLVALAVRIPPAVSSGSLGMTKADLIAALTTGQYADMPGDTPVIISAIDPIQGDYEQNGPLDQVTTRMYQPESLEMGQLYATPEDIEYMPELVRAQEETTPETAVRSIVLHARD